VARDRRVGRAWENAPKCNVDIFIYRSKVMFHFISYFFESIIHHEANYNHLGSPECSQADTPPGTW
jgi:hypothetical protein